MRALVSHTLFFVLGISLLPTFSVCAENAVVLESFETNIRCATLMTNYGGRPVLSPPGVSLSQYSRSGSKDEHVTDGAKSLRVVLSGKEKYSGDFQITLSEDASAKIRAAAASPDVARYVLRYDVIFPPMEDFVYFNSALHFADSRDVLISAGGKRTMSVALDLLTGLPAKGPLTLVFADDFDFKGDFTNVTLYFDNIRLVDTYAPGAKPLVHTLQSFEDADNAIGGASKFTEWDNDKPVERTSLSRYTATDPTDLRVTNGKHALQVSNNNPGFWHADFTLPLDKTELARVLQLDKPTSERPTREQLARYTLRWDISYPDLTDDWMNSTFHTMETFLPIIQVRQNKPKNQRQTYSVTLDQVEWGSWQDTQPILLFITEGPMKSKEIKIYYDNFRLIDTGNVPPTVEASGGGNGSGSSGGPSR